MGKVLKILVVLLLILNIGALVLACQLFSKRELIKGTNSKLATAVTQMAADIEEPTTTAPDDTATAAPSEKTLAGELKGLDEKLQTPSRTKIWESYKLSLEETDHPKVTLAAGALDHYLNAKGQSSGPGTLADTLNTVQAKAKEQLDRMNEMRAQCKALREEYAATLQELDKTTKSLTSAEDSLASSNTKVTQQEGIINPLRDEKEKLEASLQDAQTSVADQQAEMDKLTAKLAEANDQIAALKKKKTETSASSDMTQTGAVQQVVVHIEPGFKGRVAYFDPTWNFVVIEVHEDFMKELLGDDMKKPLPENVELHIYRQGEKGQFVTKVRLTSIRVSEGVAVADVLPEWNNKKWFPVNEGDGAFF